MYYLRRHQERAKVDRRRSALDRGHSSLVERLEVILPVVEGGDEEVGGTVMWAEMRHGDKVLISADQGWKVYLNISPDKMMSFALVSSKFI